MKRIPFIISIITLSFTLVACGDNVSAATTPEVSEEVENTTEYREFDGEGEGQGVIKSDDELESLKKEEASQYSSGEDYNTYIIESKEEVKEEPEQPKSKFKAENYPDYVPMDNFWISSDEFDLAGWFEANGATVMFYDMNGDKMDSDNENVTFYAGNLTYSTGIWRLWIGADNVTQVIAYPPPTGERKLMLDYCSDGGQSTIKISSTSNICVYADSLTAIEGAIKQIKADPTRESINL